MAKVTIKKASTDVITFVFILDATSTTGAGLTNLTAGGPTVYYARPGSAASSIGLVTIAATSAHSDGGFVAVDSSNMPGLYRLDLPDAVCAAGVNNAVVMLKGGTNMVPVPMEIQLTDFDLNDTTPNVTVSDIANDAITAASIKTDAITEIQTGLATPTNITSANGVTLAATQTGVTIPTVTTVGTTTNLTNLPAITNDWITSAGVSAGAVTKIQTGITAPTVGQIDTQLSGTHGSGAWGAAGTGGDKTLTYTVNITGGGVLAGATVYLYSDFTRTTLVTSKTSDALGQATFTNLVAGTYYLKTTCNGYEDMLDSEVVS